MKAAAIFIGVLAGAAGAYMAAVFLAAGSAAKTVVDGVHPARLDVDVAVDAFGGLIRT